ICIGPPVSAKSYLNIGNILKAARETGADAVHPGYGYLAESEEFARACEDSGLVFIGPTPENLQLAGDKITAKNLMKEAGVPVIPSSAGGVTDVEWSRLQGEAEDGVSGFVRIKICFSKNSLWRRWRPAPPSEGKSSILKNILKIRGILSSRS
ncbi:MAG: hypothetical protein JRF52_10285, partial [Deltaproteobacteria bacterium]|nr:hypothetical protein [Deltaproteobacteria bacterium]